MYQYAIVQTTWLKEIRKMLNDWKIFKEKVEEWNLSHCYSDCFFLMEQQISKKLEKFSVQITPEPYAFMEESM